MTTVPPTNVALPQMLAAAATPTATISAPPPAVAALQAGTELTGTVAASPDLKVMLLNTALGEVALRTPLPLPDGAQLTVEVVRASEAQVTVRLVAMDGQPLPQALSQAATQTPPNGLQESPAQPAVTSLPTAPGTPTPLPQGYAWWPTGAQPATTLPPVSAYVLASSSQALNAAAAMPDLSNAFKLPGPGGELTVRLASVTLPMASAAATLPITNASATPAPPTVPAPAPTAPVFTSGTAPTAPVPFLADPATSSGPPTSNASPPAAPAPMATPVSAAKTPPAQSPTSSSATDVPAPPLEDSSLMLPTRAGWPSAPAPPAAVAPTPQAVITGTVIGAPDGIPVVQTPNGQVQLNIRANLPVGTTVTLDVIAHQAPTTAVATPAPPIPPLALPPLATSTTGWPTLSEAVQLLQRADPAAAAQLAAAIPDGGPRTALAVMTYVQALRTGDARQWPGDINLRALERASPRGAHLATQLSDEVSDMSRQVKETPGDWRALPMPWQSDGRISRVRMVIRETGADEQSGKERGGGGTRFLVDLDLSRLGALQFDGMFRKESRNFDMMVRTRAPLPDHIRRDLVGIFANTNAAMNLVGGLSFQVVKTFPDPLAAPSSTRNKAGVWV